MKTIVVIATICLFVATGWAQDKEDKKLPPPCPKTQMIKDCFECHIKGSFKVKETAPDAHLAYPNRFTKIIGWDCNQLEGHYTVKDIDADALQEAFNYFKLHKINKLTMEMFSPGGSMFHGIKMTSLMDVWKQGGGEITTIVHGLAASAAFLVFVNGTPGKRFIAPQAQIMWHELISFKMFDVSSPSDKEDEARVLRHFQNTANEWLVSKCKLSKEEIDSRIRKKEFWLNGKMALNDGFADGFLGK